MTTDSNFLPTLLCVEAPSAMLSIFPVKTFSFPILNYTQLSFFVSFYSFRAALAVVSRGESKDGALCFPRFNTGTMSVSSSSSSISAKYEWFSASWAEILSCGDFLSIFVMRSRACWSRALYQTPSKLKLLALFCARTQLQVFPGKALTPRSSTWKMRPRLKISQMGSYLVFISFILITSGATYPGVPHRTNRYSCASANSARPKSAMEHSKLPSWRKMMFSGLRSRCMMRLLCISLSPLRMDRMIVRTSQALNLYLALMRSQSCPPESSSTTMQREFSDSKTSQRRMQLRWASARMTSISRMRHSLPLSSLQAASFEKALTAQLRPSSSLSARQTEAKLPFPIFFLGLNCSWKPRWLTRPRSASRHSASSSSDRRRQEAVSSPRSKLTEGGAAAKENLRSKSKGRQHLRLGAVSTRQCSQIATVASPSWAREAWQVSSIFPQEGAQLVKRGQVSILCLSWLQGARREATFLPFLKQQQFSLSTIPSPSFSAKASLSQRCSLGLFTIFEKIGRIRQNMNHLFLTRKIIKYLQFDTLWLRSFTHQVVNLYVIAHLYIILFDLFENAYNTQFSIIQLTQDHNLAEFFEGASHCDIMIKIQQGLIFPTASFSKI